MRLDTGDTARPRTRIQRGRRFPQREEHWLISAPIILGRMKLNGKHEPPRENSIASWTTFRERIYGRGIHMQTKPLIWSINIVRFNRSTFQIFVAYDL